MALADSQTAIGAVSALLRAQLAARTTVASVDIGRPEASAGSAGPKFNLFLYHIDIDGHLRDVALDAGQAPPIWLALHYLMTAVDEGSETDSAEAHELLGEGLLALQELNFLHPTSAALVDNPEPLKITFESGDSELLSKIMQGTDERYRVAVAFEIRPVMIAPSVPPSYAPPVLTVGPPGAEGVTVIPSLGPCLTGVEPRQFGAGATLRLSGTDLSSAQESVCLDDTCFPVTGSPQGQLLTEIPTDTTLSPGSYAITVATPDVGGRTSFSNAVIGDLLPSVTGVAAGVLTAHPGNELSGTLTINGTHLGGPDDRIFVAFYRNGTVARMLEGTGIAAQTSITATVPAPTPQLGALPAGEYLVLLRVNGVQATSLHKVDWS